MLLFYISLSAIWTFIGGIGHDAGLTPVRSGQVLAAATLFGIIGAGAAALRGTGRRDSVPVLLGYTLLALSIILLADSPQLGRFALAALLSNLHGPLSCPLFSPAWRGWIATGG